MRKEVARQLQQLSTKITRNRRFKKKKIFNMAAGFVGLKRTKRMQRIKSERDEARVET